MTEEKGKKKTRPEAVPTYSAAGVNAAREEEGLKALLRWVGKTMEFGAGPGSARLASGYFANVVDIGHGMGLAISTDGVGTKLLIAQMAHKYDTVGIDCVAMNSDDVLCVGAEPITMVDYLAVEDPKPDLLEQIGKGLYEGARQAEISICGGEIAQLKDMLKGAREGYAFDLAGTCVGLVPLDRIIVGQDVKPGDVAIGLRSSGLHSNGYTLARRVLLGPGGLALDKRVPELGRTLQEELLEPTHIYVREVKEMLHSGLEVKALLHITGDGFLNLARVKAEVGFVVDFLPEPHSIFKLIQATGKISDEEMYTVFNMGIGMCVVTSEKHASQVIDIARKHGVDAWCIGHAVVDRERKIVIEPERLISQGDRFVRR